MKYMPSKRSAQRVSLLVLSAALLLRTPPASGQTQANVPTSGLQLWLRADQGVVLNGSNVERWSNNGPTGATSEASETDASRRPLFVANAVNGKPAVRFDGVNDRLGFRLPVNGLSGMTIITVSNNLDDEIGGPDGRENAVIAWPEVNGWGSLHLSPFRSKVRFRFGTGQLNNSPFYDRSSLGNAFSTTTAIKNGAAEILFVNGAQVLSLGGKLSPTSRNSDLGRLGEGSIDTQHLNGHIAEILVYNRALTLAERQAVEGYLTQKYFAVAVAPPSGETELTLGSTLQTVINSKPAGTTFRLKSGVHRMQKITLRTGDTLYGEAGAVLNGAKPITNWTREGSLWVSSGQTHQNQTYGQCEDEFPRCSSAEDVFFNNNTLRHVTSVSQVTVGTFHFDYNADKIYIAQDPNNQQVEVAFSTAGIDGSGSNITIRDLVIEKYAQRAQLGAIQANKGSNWTIQRVEARRNHAAGIVIGPGIKIQDCNVHHNGQSGIAGGEIGNILIERNELAYNNSAGFDSGWESGGMKLATVNDVVVRDNFVHHNASPGLWCDGDCIRITYEGNRVEDNGHSGIFHEISYDAIIRNNTVKRNGLTFDPWLWGAQIQVACSRNVEVYGNVVVVDAAGGHGIAILQQDRGSGGRYGLQLLRNNYVHHNDVTYMGEAGRSGAVADWDKPGMLSGGNRFNYNTYYYRGEQGRFQWPEELTWNQFRATGQEANGTLR